MNGTNSCKTTAATAWEFPARLKTARSMRAMSQAALAEMAGLPAASISHYEAGRREPSLGVFRTLARALDVDADYLLGWHDEPRSSRHSNSLERQINALATHERDFLADLLDTMGRNRVGRERDRRVSTDVPAIPTPWTALKMDPALLAAVATAVQQVKAMTPEQVAEMVRRQGESYARAEAECPDL